MIIKKRMDGDLQDIEVLICYPKESSQLNRVISLLGAIDKQVHCKTEHRDRERLVNAADIYYIESVDKKTFVYLEKEVFQTDAPIYKLQNLLSTAGFVQISKSCLLNLNVLEAIKPLLNSRMEAILSNGEKLHVTRKYLGTIKQTLQEGSQGRNSFECIHSKLFLYYISTKYHAPQETPAPHPQDSSAIHPLYN